MLSTEAASRRPDALASATVVQQLADCVDELAVLLGGGCLVQTANGRLLAHALQGDVPPAVVQALVTGDLLQLQGKLSRRRATGLLPSGPVIEAQLPERRRIAFVALRDGDTDLGGVWMLPAGDCPLALEELRAPIQRLTSLLTCAAPGDGEPSLAACLEGEAGSVLPSGLANANQFWVARLGCAPGLSSQALVSSVTTNAVPAPFCARALRLGRDVYVVLGGPRSTSAGDALHAMQLVVSATAGRLGAAVSAGLSEPCTASALAVGRLQADAAQAEASSGACTPLGQVRSRVVVKQAAHATAQLVDLGPEPLTALLDYDERRGADLADTLLAWLEAFGDVPRATAALGIHCNTLRYRLRRIEEITGVDLRHDVYGRLDLHLGLLRRPGRTR